MIKLKPLSTRIDGKHLKLGKMVIAILATLLLFSCAETESDDESNANVNNGTPGITISTISGNTGEDLSTATFTVSLNTEPDGDVVIDVSSDDSTEGTVTSSTPLTFNASTWSVDQTVDVQGVDDNLVDGNQNYSIELAINASTADSSGYADLTADYSVAVTNNDDDTIGLDISTISGNTDESGDTATFTVSLNTLPDDDVVIDVSSDDSTEGTVTSSTPLTFTTANWSVDQTVDVQGVNDNLVDGNQNYSIELAINASTADSSGYADLSTDSVTVINVDDNFIGVNVSQTGRFTNESGTSVDFSVSLGSQPSSDVTFPLSSSNEDEGTLSVDELTFTSANWDTSQDVTVSGEDDPSFDAAQLYTIEFAAASSSDSSYDGYDDPSSDLTLYNLDDEYKLPDTGQTTRYSDTTGDDSDTLINAPSYTDNSDDTVTDNNTGLIWQRQDDSTTRTWTDAGPYCDGLTLGAQSDWRLPDKKELASIADYGTYSPAIDSTAFPGTNSSYYSSYYWSSATYASDTSFAWRLLFSIGFIGNGDKTGSFYVRCVRSSQFSTVAFADLGDQTVLDRKTGLIWQQGIDYSTRNWEAAISYCDGLNLAGRSDWRLPNVRELESITDDSKYSPAIDSTAFPGTLSLHYWSSTTVADSTSDAWYVHFSDGFVNSGSNKTVSFYVRCVRSEQ